MAILPLAFIIAFGTELGQWALPAGTTGVLAIWAPAGLLLGGLVLSERRRWLAHAAVGALIIIASMLFHGSAASSAVFAALGTALQAAAGAWLLQRFRGTPFTLNRVTEALALVGAAVVTAALGALLPAAFAGGVRYEFWQAFTVSAAVGVMLFAPLVIAWRVEWDAPHGFFEPRSLAELAVVAGGAAVTAHLVFGGFAPAVVQVPALTLPFFIWGAFRFGPAGGSVTVLVLCWLGLAHTARGTGPLAMPDGDTNVDLLILRAQGAVSMSAVSFLLLASVVAERREAMFERARLVGELQTALAEIKTLRGLIPICAWCHKVRDDADVWQGLETYLDAHTDATFSHSICPTCSEKQSVAAEHWRI